MPKASRRWLKSPPPTSRSESAPRPCARCGLPRKPPIATSRWNPRPRPNPRKRNRFKMTQEDRNRADARFNKAARAASDAKTGKTERDVAAKAVLDNMAKLKALRLARE